MKDLERFCENSRRQIVAEVLAGTMSKEKARKIYGIKSKSAILEWMRIFAGLPRNSGLDPVPLLKNMSEEKDEIFELKTKILQLEEELKLSRLKGKAFKIMVDIAKADYGLDLEKKSGVKQSRNSK
jgi:transposase-like protein